MSSRTSVLGDGGDNNDKKEHGGRERESGSVMCVCVCVCVDSLKRVFAREFKGKQHAYRVTAASSLQP